MPVKGATVAITIDDTSCTQPAPYNSGFIHSMHFCMLVTCDQPTFAHSVLEAKALEQILSNARQFLKMVTSTKTATKQCTHWKYACPLHRRVKISVFISTNIIGRLSSLCVHKILISLCITCAILAAGLGNKNCCNLCQYGTDIWVHKRPCKFRINNLEWSFVFYLSISAKCLCIILNEVV